MEVPGFVVLSGRLPAGVGAGGRRSSRRRQRGGVFMSGDTTRRDFVLSSSGALLGLGAGLALPAQKADAMWSSFVGPRKYGEEESIFDTKIGSYLPPRPLQLFERRLRNLPRAVIVGETHTNPLHHRAELEVIESLHQLEPDRPLVIGMEHFYRQHQPYLNAFISRKINLVKLHELTQWDSTFGYEFAMWSPILQYCQDNAVPILGLNVPYPVVHAVSQYGIEQLPEEVQARLPEMDLRNERHLERFKLNLGLSDDNTGVGNHGFNASSPAFHRYYQAATLWDEYMAESASKFLSRPENSRSRIVVLAGAAHVAGRDGIPDRISRRIGESCFTILPQGVQWENHNPKITAPPRRDFADWVWYTRREIDLV